MKHLKQLLLLAFLFTIGLLLNACASTKQTDYQSFNPDGADTRMTFFSRGDKVVKQTTDNVLTYDFLGFKDAEEAEKEFSKVYDTSIYEGIEGVKQSLDFKEDRLVEHIEIDHSKAKFSEVAPIIGLSKEEAKSYNHVSLSKTIETLEEEGYTEIKNGKFQELPKP